MRAGPTTTPTRRPRPLLYEPHDHASGTLDIEGVPICTNAQRRQFELYLHFTSKRELIEALAVRNPEWPQFVDRLWGGLLVSCEARASNCNAWHDRRRPADPWNLGV